jgi:hypothetical protein
MVAIASMDKEKLALPPRTERQARIRFFQRTERRKNGWGRWAIDRYPDTPRRQPDGHEMHGP